MENLYKIRAYRWNESKYELTEPYLIAGNSKDETRDSLVAYLGDGWKASEAFEIKYETLRKRRYKCTEE